MRFAICCFSLCAAAVSVAAPPSYVVRTNPVIDLVNVATNVEVSFSNAGFATDSLAVGSGGSLYSADANGVIHNVTTPFTFPVGPTGYTQIGDLDYASGGLWGFSNANQTLFFFDFSATAVTYAVPLPSLSSVIVAGVAYRPADGSIFLSGYQGFNNDLLFQVPPSASSANLVGTMANGDAGSYFADIDFDVSGTLYAMTWYHRDFYSVSTTTGATTLVSNGPHRDVTGMAIPVPEPASVCSIAAALIVFARPKRI